MSTIYNEVVRPLSFMGASLCIMGAIMGTEKNPERDSYYNSITKEDSYFDASKKTLKTIFGTTSLAKRACLVVAACGFAAIFTGSVPSISISLIVKPQFSSPSPVVPPRVLSEFEKLSFCSARNLIPWSKVPGEIESCTLSNLCQKTDSFIRCLGLTPNDEGRKETTNLIKRNLKNLHPDKTASYNEQLYLNIATILKALKNKTYAQCGGIWHKCNNEKEALAEAFTMESVKQYAKENGFGDSVKITKYVGQESRDSFSRNCDSFLDPFSRKMVVKNPSGNLYCLEERRNIRPLGIDLSRLGKPHVEQNRKFSLEAEYLNEYLMNNYASNAIISKYNKALESEEEFIKKCYSTNRHLFDDARVVIVSTLGAESRYCIKESKEYSPSSISAELMQIAKTYEEAIIKMKITEDLKLMKQEYI